MRMPMRMSMLLLGAVLLLTPAVRAVAEGGSAGSTVDDEVSVIRALYGQVAQPDDSCFGAPCLEAETTFNRMMPGSGPQITHVNFHYAEHLPDEEQIYGRPYLQKAVVKYNIAAQEFYVEYLFAGVKPALVFHFQVDHLTERRTWFHDGKAIRIDARPKGEPGAKVVRDSGFTKAELDHVRATHERAAELLALFGSLVGTADGEMGGWFHEDE